MDKKNEKLNVEVFDYSTIPKSMQEHGRFCLWKLVMKLDKIKPDKIPYQLNGKRANATNSQHYSSFEETLSKKLWRHLQVVVMRISALAALNH